MKGNKATTQCEEKPKRTKQPSSQQVSLDELQQIQEKK